jgi:hypothetical protein
MTQKVDQELKESLDKTIRYVYQRGLWEMKRLGKMNPSTGVLSGNTHR